MDTNCQKKQRFNRKEILDFQWNHYQRDIFDWVTHGEGNAMVIARAGTGKTTTIKGIVAHLPSKSKISVVAFNRHIAEELEDKLPSSVSVATAHRLGMGLLCRFFSGNVFKPNDQKYREIIATQVTPELQKRWRAYVSLYSKDPEKALSQTVPPPDLSGNTPPSKATLRNCLRFVGELVRFCQLTLTNPTPEALAQMCHYYSIEFEDGTVPEWSLAWLSPFVSTVLSEGERQAEEDHNISLDDLLWLPNRWDITPTFKDFLIVDEGQDLNAAMQGIYLKYAQQGTRVIALADPAQSLYGFTGSDPEACDRLMTALNPTILKLSECLRCPSSHLDLARRLVPDIENRPNADEGNIQVIHPARVKEFAQPGDLILCRLTAPLVQLSLRLAQQGLRVTVRGSDIGTGLSSLARKALIHSNESLSSLKSALENYCKPLIETLLANGDDLNAETLTDKRIAIAACWDEIYRPGMEFDTFATRLEALFSDSTPWNRSQTLTNQALENGSMGLPMEPLTLSTVHRAKGDEANRVFLLGSNLLPFTGKVKQPWQATQEENLTYVALTRSKMELFLVPLPEKPGIPVEQEVLDDPFGGIVFPNRVKTQTLPSRVNTWNRSASDAQALANQDFANGSMNGSITTPWNRSTRSVKDDFSQAVNGTVPSLTHGTVHGTVSKCSHTNAFGAVSQTVPSKSADGVSDFSKELEDLTAILETLEVNTECAIVIRDLLQAPAIALLKQEWWNGLNDQQRSKLRTLKSLCMEPFQQRYRFKPGDRVRYTGRTSYNRFLDGKKLIVIGIADNADPAYIKVGETDESPTIVKVDSIRHGWPKGRAIAPLLPATDFLVSPDEERETQLDLTLT